MKKNVILNFHSIVIHIILLQIAEKQKPLSKEEQEATNMNPCGRPKSSCTIFLGYTSNMASCGVRETIRFLAQHNMVRAIKPIPKFLSLGHETNPTFNIFLCVTFEWKKSYSSKKK